MPVGDEKARCFFEDSGFAVVRVNSPLGKSSVS
jgi:hypothetical protein